MRFSSQHVMYDSISMKTCPTDKPLKILRLYWPVNTSVSMACMRSSSSRQHCGMGRHTLFCLTSRSLTVSVNQHPISIAWLVQWVI